MAAMQKSQQNDWDDVEQKPENYEEGNFVTANNGNSSVAGSFPGVPGALLSPQRLLYLESIPAIDRKLSRRRFERRGRCHA
jgi:hypothetical protein